MSSSIQDPLSLARPWLAIYAQREAALATRYRSHHPDALTLFRNAVRIAGQGPAIRYFDATISYKEVDRLSDAFARYLRQSGVAAGDRVALYLQNVPQFLICLVGAWKAGAVGVSINPMSRARELRLLLEDSGARFLVAQIELYTEVAREVLAQLPQVAAVTTRASDFQTRNDPRLFQAPEPAAADVPDLLAVLEQAPPQGEPLAAAADGASTAMIVYTSGTTGIPKGAMITHQNLAFQGGLWRDWLDLRTGAPVLGIAPLFHITGLAANIAASFAFAAPLILTMRFHPDVVSQAAEEHEAEFVVGAITAFISIMNSPGVQPQQWRSLRHVYSGGAPVPAAVAAKFQEQFGLPIHNCYGLTESTSLTVSVPGGVQAPIDVNGALSIGLPVFDTDVYIADEAGRPAPAGEVGELMLRGPQVMAGYWQRTEETAATLHNGYLRTGDVGYMDANGWVFLVDRKKDMIIASGYKVWPKEVEDVLYTHPAVREAAVVGVPDDYRGETVKAVLALRQGCTLDVQEITAFCRERLAAYKVPKVVEFRAELPKTLSGKILRRELK